MSISSVFGLNTTWNIPPVLNITIVSYIYFHPDLLSSRPFNGPAIELGVQYLRETYNFNVTLQYVGDDSICSVPDLVANVYRVASFFYHRWDRNGIIALVFPGMIQYSCSAIILSRSDYRHYTTLTMMLRR